MKAALSMLEQYRDIFQSLLRARIRVRIKLIEGDSISTFNPQSNDGDIILNHFRSPEDEGGGGVPLDMCTRGICGPLSSGAFVICQAPPPPIFLSCKECSPPNPQCDQVPRRPANRLGYPSSGSTPRMCSAELRSASSDHGTPLAVGVGSIAPADE